MQQRYFWPWFYLNEWCEQNLIYILVGVWNYCCASWINKCMESGIIAQVGFVKMFYFHIIKNGNTIFILMLSLQLILFLWTLGKAFPAAKEPLEPSQVEGSLQRAGWKELDTRATKISQLWYQNSTKVWQRWETEKKLIKTRQDLCELGAVF